MKSTMCMLKRSARDGMCVSEDLNQSAHPHSLIRALVLSLKRLPIEHPLKTLIRLHKCSVLSESLMDAHANLYHLLDTGSIIVCQIFFVLQMLEVSCSISSQVKGNI